MSTQQFQRARNEDQRAERRAAILSAAVELLGERRVAELSLNELARRAGLAKSNVLRYFESREAVLLEVYDREYRAWLDALEAALPSAGEATIETVATAVADSVAARRMFCELSASAAAVLEHNVSGQVAVDYKLAAIANAIRLAELVGGRLGGFSDPVALGFVSGVNLGIAGVWASTQPSPGMAAAYEAHPELAAYRHDFRRSLREFVATLLTGLVHREPELDGIVPTESAGRAGRPGIPG